MPGLSALGLLVAAVTARAVSPECRVVQAVAEHPAILVAFPTAIASGPRLAEFVPVLAGHLRVSARDERELRRKVMDEASVSWPADCQWKGPADTSGLSAAFTRPIITDNGRLALVAYSGGGVPVASGFGRVCVVRLAHETSQATCNPLWVH